MMQTQCPFSSKNECLNSECLSVPMVGGLRLATKTMMSTRPAEPPNANASCATRCKVALVVPIYLDLKKLGRPPTYKAATNGDAANMAQLTYARSLKRNIAALRDESHHLQNVRDIIWRFLLLAAFLGSKKGYLTVHTSHITHPPCPPEHASSRSSRIAWG